MPQLLTIDLLGWNGAVHLERTARALQAVPKDIAAIRYIDNSSQDASCEIIRDLLPNAEIIKLPENKGFAYAHNLGISRCNTPYILTLDQDIELIWDGIAKLLDEMEKNTKLGAVQGKLYRKEGKKIIDSAGISKTLALNGKERGANEKDSGQYETSTRLFAVTGGCGLYRIAALKSVAQSEEVFDEDFFAYKEDVDLGWRLNNALWQVKYIPVLVGHHARTMGKRGVLNWGASPRAISQRISNMRTMLSLRNYIWMLVKNMTFADEFKHNIFIAMRLFVFFVFSLFSPQLFKAWIEAWHGIPSMLIKRAEAKRTQFKPEGFE